MKKAMLAMMFLAGGSLFAAPRVAVGIGFGAPAPVVAARPACPGPGYAWVDGYYAPNHNWVPGYWAPPVRARVALRYGHAPVMIGGRDRRFEFEGQHDFRR